MKKMLMLLSAILFLQALAAYQTVIAIDPNGWNNNRTEATKPVILEPGQPMLPYLPVSILLPFGETYLDAQISLTAPQLKAEGVEIKKAIAQLPTSETQAFMYFTDAKANNARVATNGENLALPTRDWVFLGTQYYRGYQIALFNIYPYKYNPTTRQVFASSQVNITVNSTFSASEAGYQANFYTPGSDTGSVLRTLVVNPETMSSYQSAASYRNVAPGNRLIDLTYPKQMIIVTDNQRMSWFSQYGAWRAGLGVSNAVYSMEDILASYPGADNAEKLRNFIIHAYQTWATSSEPLQYVILGGDDEIIPERGAYGQVGDTIDQRMPVDIYYSNLDGNWNANSNQIYGEVADNTDLMPEVHIGRFPAESEAEFQNMFRKIQHYVDSNTYSNSLALFMGENLNWDPVTWGGDYKDDVAQYLPAGYHLQTLYQREGTYSSSSVWNAINNGAGVMNHMGHANEFSLIGQGNSTVEALQNNEYGFLYSQGCYPAAFDQRTSAAGESIGEHLVTASGALFSFIGNTRYGWYMPGDINGASQYYDRQFFRGLFQENQPQLGKALSFSRLQNLNSALSNDVMRWCYYEVVLFGDPSIAVKAPDPNMPLLNLESYSFSDEEGDNDGTINPGEVIRFYPVISNAMGWGTASNITVRVESAPAGIEFVGEYIHIPQILPGGMNPQTYFLQTQLPTNLPFGTYTIHVVVDSQYPNSNNNTGERRFEASFQLTLIDSRFPWETPNAGKSAPLVGEFSSQPGQEVLYADVFGNGYIIGNNGETISTFNAPAGMNISRSFASGAIDTEAGADLAFCSRSGDIYATSLSGENIFTFHANTSFLFSPVLADLDGDGYSETITGGLDGKIYVVSNNGYQPYGFPLDLESTFHCDLAAADFNEDGSFEIVAGTSAGKLFVIDGLGNIKPGFPLQLDGAITGSPTITNDKRIVCATGTSIYIVSQTGSIISSRAIDTHIAGGFAIADITGDNMGIDVVGVSLSGRVYAFTNDGGDLPGFPVDTGVNFNCPPLLANLDDDPQLEILLHSYVNSVYGYNHDGSPLEGFPFITSYNGSTPATLTDFDGDGWAKLVMGHSNGVLMLNLRRSAGDLAPWVTYRGSAERQGSFASTGYVAVTDDVQIPVFNSLGQNYPNPFNPNTTISYSLKGDTAVKLEVYNLKGQKVRTLCSAPRKAGTYTAVWDGKDESGKSVGSGVYLYRLRANNETIQRRMLLLK